MSSNEIRIHKTLARCGILAVVLLATLCRCARQAAPQGGPRDSLPPKVVTMTPAFGTTHFKDKRILIEFDEYVQLEDQQKEFFTSPFMEQKPVLSIRGRSVQIDLKEDLDSNRTYALDFGSSVVDNNEGNPYVGLRYVFSTGGEIDSLLMSGYTVDAQKGDRLRLDDSQQQTVERSPILSQRHFHRREPEADGLPHLRARRQQQ